MVFAAGLALLLLGRAMAQADRPIATTAPTALLESGAPSFVVLGPESLGLSTAPVDLHRLPDGRILVVAQHEIAFGDGVRWETFQETGNQPHLLASVAVDRDGLIYTGMEGGVARIDLSEGARWHFTPVQKFSGDATTRTATMTMVTMGPEQWYWFGTIDAIVTWRPGQSPHVIGRLGAVDRIFALGQNLFLSDLSSGRFSQLAAGAGKATRVPAADDHFSGGITCAIPFGPAQLLVGTNSKGLKIFDGTTFRPFGPPGLLNSGNRITDLCPTGEGLFAAAVDTVGIVFFDREGRTVQVLERLLDHRLARVRHLEYAPNGVLWALLNEGVARVEFPSPLSHFEPLLTSGLVFAQPLRHAGRLWILADGRAMQAVYDATGRLERFEENSPPGDFLFTLTAVDGQLFAGNDTGIFVHGATGWRMILPGIVSARLGVARSTKDGIFYVARGEYGTIRQTGESFVAHRIPRPDLGDSYNAHADAAGIGWLELGVSHVGRLDPNGGNPTLEIFGNRDGLEDGWVELYVLDGIARFHINNHLYRFDDPSRKFVEDRTLLARYPQFASAGGRPITDSLGRLWYSANGATQVIDHTATGVDYPVKTIPVGFTPTSYTADRDGIVWMHEKRRLVRMDLRMPQPPDSPLRALITSVQFSASSRHLFAPGATLAPLDYADNSFVIHFAAPANPFGSPITFEVLLEGADPQWVSTGAVGSAAFNRLKEGHYVFHVRPTAGPDAHGEEARLEFTVRPPWFRTALAWCLYVFAALGLVGLAAWLSAFLQRRENERLERLVAERTREVNATNLQLNRQIGETTEKSLALFASEERYRTLNTELEYRVQERTAELSHSNAELAQRESLFRLIFEHAPVGIFWKRTDLGDNFNFNPTFRRILDFKVGSVNNLTDLGVLVHPEDSLHQTEMSARLAAGEIDSYNLEERFVRADGRLVWGALSVAVVREPSGRIVQKIGILEDVTARKQAEHDLANTYKNLVEASRMAGMAEVATGVLHNVGNVLNSLNVSSRVIATGVRQSKAESLARLSTLLGEHTADLGDFLTHDPKGRRVPEFLATLAQHSLAERDRLLEEIASMQKNIDHIKEIVAMQQGYARVAGVIETLDAASLFADARNMNAASLSRHDVNVVEEFQPVPPVTVEKGKVLQILTNLIRNAMFACDDAHQDVAGEKTITLRIEPAPDHRVRLIVRDNGVGIPPENLIRIFSHGFTTRAEGHGFGLHSSAVAAKEMQGSLTVFSQGPGQGATFTLELPVVPAAAAGETAPSPTKAGTADKSAVTPNGEKPSGDGHESSGSRKPWQVRVSRPAAASGQTNVR